MRKSSQYLYRMSMTRNPDEVDQFPLRHGDSPDRDEGMNKGRYAAYTRLKFDRPAPRVLRITFASPLKLSAMDARMHQEIADVWKDVAHDDSTKAVLLTGEGQTFSPLGRSPSRRNSPAAHTAQFGGRSKRSITGCEEPDRYSTPPWA